jgi:hypothetical protein
VENSPETTRADVREQEFPFVAEAVQFFDQQLM